MKHSRLFMLVLFATLCSLAVAAPATTGMNSGKVDVKSAGPLAFGPNGILFIGDSLGAQIVAIDTGDTKAVATASLNVSGIDGKVASVLGTSVDQLSALHVVANPISKNVYISVNRGRGADAKAVLLKLDTAGKLSEVSLDNVKYCRRRAAQPSRAEQPENQHHHKRPLHGRQGAGRRALQ